LRWTLKRRPGHQFGHFGFHALNLLQQLLFCGRRLHWSTRAAGGFVIEDGGRARVGFSPALSLVLEALAAGGCCTKGLEHLGHLEGFVQRLGSLVTDLSR
jgi:hypothetical protein